MMLLLSGAMALVEETPPPSRDGETRSQRHRRRKLLRKLRAHRYWQRNKKRLTMTRGDRVISTYDGFVDALIARRKQLGWSQLELDERAGFQPGYSGKLEAWRGPQGRVAGSVTMPLWLQALGLGFLPVVETDGALPAQRKALEAITRPMRAAVDLARRIPPEDVS